MQEQAGPALKGTLKAIPQTRVLGYGLDYAGVGPVAVGQRIPMNPMYDPQWGGGGYSDTSIYIDYNGTPHIDGGNPIPITYQNGATMSVSDRSTSALYLHGQSQVIFAMQSEVDALMQKYIIR